MIKSRYSRYAELVSSAAIMILKLPQKLSVQNVFASFLEFQKRNYDEFYLNTDLFNDRNGILDFIRVMLDFSTTLSL